jgi:uncharacterized protein (TIGR03437 family)
MATPEGLYGPLGLCLDRHDTLYVADSTNNRVTHFLKPGSVVNGATFQASLPVAQGALATFFGTGLDVDPSVAGVLPLPRALADRELVVNDEPAPVMYAGAGQVNFQVPTQAPVGNARVAVRMACTKELLSGGTMVVATLTPGIYTTNASGQALAVNQDGSLNSPANPAARGSVITLYGTGQGQVNPPVDDGAPAPASPPATTAATPTTDGKTCQKAQENAICAVVGNTMAVIQFSGLAPNMVGVWQINLQIPPDTITGSAVPMVVVISGAWSNTVKIAVK